MAVALTDQTIIGIARAAIGPLYFLKIAAIRHDAALCRASKQIPQSPSIGMTSTAQNPWIHALKKPVVAILFWLPATPALSGDSALDQCADVTQPNLRLQCFDALARQRKVDPAFGEIRICRTSGVVGPHQDDAIDIPAGTSVVNDGQGLSGSVVLATTEAVTLQRGESCVNARARIKENPGRQSVRASSWIYYHPSSDQHLPMIGYTITVSVDFK